MQKIFRESTQAAKNHYIDFNDPMHDWSHSQRVASNAELIGRHVDALNLELLRLAAFWHDTARTLSLEVHEEPGAQMARKDLLSRGLDYKSADIVYKAIYKHKLSDKPETLEGKIIRDADKLDFISVRRWQNGLKAGQYEVLSQIFSRLEELPDRFSFDFSKELYRQRLPGFLKFYESIENELPQSRGQKDSLKRP